MASHTFLVTGASSGLGLSLTTAALKRGHKVVACARNVTKASQSHPDVEKLGGVWIELDVTKADTQERARDAVEKHGVTVVVNNAGYSLCGALEDISEEDIHIQFNTNVFGPIRVIKGALPSLRKTGGTIVNITSVAGYDGLPSCSMYAGSKFALEGISESLSRDLAPFNIRLLAIEPGAFRTNFLKPSAMTIPSNRLSLPYLNTPVDEALQKFKRFDGIQPGNPEKAAQTMMDVITLQGKGKDWENRLRCILGEDALGRAEAKRERFAQDVGASWEIGCGLGFE